MARMADKEREVKLLQDLGWDYGGVSSFGFSSVRKRSLVIAISMTIQGSICSIRPIDFAVDPIGSNALLDSLSTQ